MTAAADFGSVLDRWGLADASVSPLGRGLINQTYLVEGAQGRFVLQKLSPIFDPAIHNNIVAVTEHLARKGVASPRLVQADEGGWWVDTRDQGERGGIWRLQTALEGVGFEVLEGAGQARVAGEFVGRWHGALRDLDHEFEALRVGVHDTPRHLARLREAVEEGRGHRLHDAVAPLAEAILEGAESLPAIPASVRPRPSHGDLKINNLLFTGEGEAAQALALIDLDTVAPMTLAYELGDAWRSWCNRAGEDEAQARFDLEIFAASWAGWSKGWGDAGGGALDAEERRSLLAGPEWISLELAARFAADALFESYFGWDAARFPGRGEHNLHRARGQWSLHEAVLASRPARADLLG
ncbi:aminoglycoside phosphotransferase family protein [Pseudenhygromyxa sp. WMMC2535]|uniref:phosphotransferase enzyme family protein n=1 Tax=Pseudenhygromyxa sp. WMMC2535 TaxID=2712867 RepID=UPI001553A02D|nr:aminoglycoside phosphotransferase family protein [Pseudenhygromyxa sp. WMMC2535]NVB40481.1 aminoglycoside phosphotransferase family protein [Pseudenhygromyxa sp. WMMC2535]